DTYLFGGYDTPRQVVRQFLAARRDRWTDDWEQRSRAAGLDRVSVLALASIVEAEAFRAEEMPLIAAVYRNRIRIGMPLQADPTIQYAFLLDRGERVPRMLNRDYAYQSPYNTYLYRGLPPTPIGNPSDAAIEAVLSPADVTYLYFVARGDGSHRFSTTYQEHLRTIREIRGP
ncbi:MAG TPA: endolytic transglycosylase MltG, partial [Gemmatimonadales bacterium]|nr:endolytic transglycosylase MltG [Gemmatimonadales bacterium]